MPPTSIKTFMGNSLNSSEFDTKYINPADGTEAINQFIPQPEADSVNADTFTVGQRDVLLFIRIKQSIPRDTAAENASREKLLRYFERGKRGPLVGGFDDAVDYQLDCSVNRLSKNSDDTMVYLAHLVSADTYWRAKDADSDSSWTPTGTSGTKAYTINGTAPTRMSLTMTPSAAPAGVWLYQNIAQLINVPGLALGYKSFCITLDTAALVAAGQCQDDCSDFRLKDAGKMINRWIVNPNTASTKIWFNLNLKAGYALTLSGGTAQVETATAVGTITLSGNATVTVTAAGMTGSPKAISVPVLITDTAAVWAGKVRAALLADGAVTALFKVSGSGTAIVLVRKSPAGNDATLNIALANGTCTGITAAPTSANTTAGVLYSLDASSTYTTISWDITTANRGAIVALPSRFIIAHGTEWFSCMKTSTSVQECEVTVLQRGAWGTTKQVHNGGDIFYYIEHPLVLYAGNNAALDPTTVTNYNNTKPVFSLTSSDNTQETVTTSDKFYDLSYPNKPGSWKPFLTPSNRNSKAYRFTANATSGNPALGVKAAAYQPNGTWLSDVISGGWLRADERKFRRITVTGRKYRSGSNWPGITQMECSADGANWDLIFTEATPGSAGAWANWSAHTNVDIDNTSKFIRLLVRGGSGVVANSYQMFEALTSVLYYTTANIPSLTLLGWTSNYMLDVKIKNTATIDGVTYRDIIFVNLPMLLNKAIVLDAEAVTAEYDNVNCHGAISLDDESRSVWLRAWPGVTNTVTIVSVSAQSIGTLPITMSHYRRRS